MSETPRRRFLEFIDGRMYAFSVGLPDFIPLEVLEHMVRCQVGAAMQLHADIVALAALGYLPARRYLARQGGTRRAN